MAQKACIVSSSWTVKVLDEKEVDRQRVGLGIGKPGLMIRMKRSRQDREAKREFATTLPGERTPMMTLQSRFQLRRLNS
jgi:hypothetical protein